MSNLNKLVKFNLLFCIFIILWGAWVRLSGSGAGCGDHWPLCDGEVIPLAPSMEKIIEYTHRFTSGLFGITVLFMTVWGRKTKSASSLLKRSLYGTLFFTVTEALIGAVLVKKGLVVDNNSLARAWVMGFHLINTFFLVGSLVLADFYSKEKLSDSSENNVVNWQWFVALVILLFVGATGAIAALGNTLFPATDLMESVRDDFFKGSNILIRLRVFHPILALSGCALILKLILIETEKIRESRLLLMMIFLAVLLGGLNWALLAPSWLVLIHLFMANLIWILTLRQILFRRYGVPHAWS